MRRLVLHNLKGQFSSRQRGPKAEVWGALSSGVGYNQAPRVVSFSHWKGRQGPVGSEQNRGCCLDSVLPPGSLLPSGGPAPILRAQRLALTHGFPILPLPQVPDSHLLALPKNIDKPSDFACY